ncbi:hypothetical protein [Corynebacterium glyciniphilum]|uniref:hypothetical protein n=1 Tax=Corynebacterium glyciniphilum TaxID=1404244 RepID=UPI002655580B|nr:hypothetical protein [Corynebacterium glyciniphilum]MDN5684013.1 hypothetical protein [Corynebacterium glyciniphilum]
MATDKGRINAAIAGVSAVEYEGPEKEIALDFLAGLRDAVDRVKYAEVRADQFVPAGVVRDLISVGDL